MSTTPSAPIPSSPRCRVCGKPLTYVVTYRHEDDPPFYFSVQSPGPPGRQTLTMTITTPSHVPEPDSPKRKALLTLSDRELDDLNNRVRPAVNKFLDATGRDGGKASTETKQ